MIIDLSCPIELRGYELLNDDNGSVRAYIRLFNLSDKHITAYSATVSWFNALTRARVTESISVDECVIEPESMFKLIHSTKNIARIDHVEMYFASVVFEDGTAWQPFDGDLIDIGEQKRLAGAELDRLKAVAGADAVQYPQVQKEYWRCVCGRVNLLSQDACARCKRDRNEVLKKLNEKAVNAADVPGGKSAEVKIHRSVYKKEEKHPVRTLLKVLLVILLIAAAAYLGFRFGAGDLGDSAEPDGSGYNDKYIRNQSLAYSESYLSGSYSALLLRQSTRGQSMQF